MSRHSTILVLILFMMMSLLGAATDEEIIHIASDLADISTDSFEVISFDTDIAIGSLPDVSDGPSSGLVSVTVGDLTESDIPAETIDPPISILEIFPVDLNASPDEPENANFNLSKIRLNDIWEAFHQMAENYMSEMGKKSESSLIVPEAADQTANDPYHAEVSIDPVAIDRDLIDPFSGIEKSAFQSDNYYSGKANFDNTASRWQTGETSNSFLRSESGRFNTGWSNNR